MNRMEVNDVVNKIKAYIKANDELINEYLVKIKESSNEKEMDRLFRLVKICKKSISDSQKQLSIIDEIDITHGKWVFSFFLNLLML